MKESYQKYIERITHFFVQRSIQSASPKVTKSWIINIIFSLCIAVLLCGIGFYVLFFSKNEEILQSSTATSTEPFFSDARLKEVVEDFRNQITRFNELRQNAPTAPITGMPETAEISIEEGENEKVSEGIESEAQVTQELEPQM